MALFGRNRDVSLIRTLNRELIGRIISQQCAYYKLSLDKTNTNIYGEAPEGKYFNGPFLLNGLINIGEQNQPTSEIGVGFTWNVEFSFLLDDLRDANIDPEIGDIIMYQEGYFEIDNVKINQLFVGKDPDYPYAPNPYNTQLDNFGYNVSAVCNTHYVPGDRLNITKARFNG